MNMGVWIYGNRYCGKKHCHSITKCGQKKSAASSKIWIIMPKTYHEYFSYLCWIRLRRYTSLWQVLQYSLRFKLQVVVKLNLSNLPLNSCCLMYNEQSCRGSLQGEGIIAGGAFMEHGSLNCGGRMGRDGGESDRGRTFVVNGNSKNGRRSRRGQERGRRWSERRRDDCRRAKSSRR